MPDIKEPKFVFAHVMCPHPPYLFDRNGPVKFNVFGSESSPYQEEYREQSMFISKKVTALMDEILSKSDIAPIIILQADHGSWGVEGRQADILNAYYLPRKDNHLLYETITPVNSFRVVFNLYFDADYELLNDISYDGWPREFTLLPPEVEEGAE